MVISWVELLGLYLVGFVITLIVLIKYGKSKFGFDFDRPKTYVNYDDYDSSGQAYLWFSIGWFILAPIGIIIYSFNKVAKFIQKLINE